MIHLYESMKIGYSTLEWSAEQQEDAKNVGLFEPKGCNIFQK